MGKGPPDKLDLLWQAVDSVISRGKLVLLRLDCCKRWLRHAALQASLRAKRLHEFTLDGDCW
eukprot:1353664-Amphidinium_carterae.1